MSPNRKHPPVLSQSGDLILIAVGAQGDIWIDGDQIDPRFIRLPLRTASG